MRYLGKWTLDTKFGMDEKKSLTIKKNKFDSFVGKRMHLEAMILSEINQAHMLTYHAVSLRWISKV